MRKQDSGFYLLDFILKEFYEIKNVFRQTHLLRYQAGGVEKIKFTCKRNARTGA